MGKVSIVKINGSIRESLIACLDNIGGLLSYVKPGDKVLLKPNINGTEAVTDTRIVEALILLLRECGVGQIAVAESTFVKVADSWNEASEAPQPIPSFE